MLCNNSPSPFRGGGGGRGKLIDIIINYEYQSKDDFPDKRTKACIFGAGRFIFQKFFLQTEQIG